MISIQDIDKEINELKLSINTRGRIVATEFLKQFVWLFQFHRIIIPYFTAMIPIPSSCVSPSSHSQFAIVH